MTAARGRRGVRATATAGLACALLLGATPSPARAQTPARPQTPDEHQDQPTGPGPEMLVRAFGSVDWGATELPGTPNSFALGQFDLFVNASLNDRVSVLAEIVMEASGANTRVVTDLERLQLTFRVNDHLQVTAGRYHTGIGFYNTAFHHGSYFETPIGRPRVFAFEDEGGVLPVHEVGISARGTVPRTGSALHYLAEIGNGRTWAASESSEGRDQNGSKSSNIGLSLRPERWHGLEIGTSLYRDAIPDPPSSDLSHRIATAYLVYRTQSAEVMAEWLSLSHRTADRRVSRNHGGYAQASRAWGTVRPYYRFDRLAVSPSTPLIGDRGSYQAHVAGLRVDPAMWIGLKAQYERTNEAGLRGIDAVRTQLVFVF
jgi:hypothetical protein